MTDTVSALDLPFEQAIRFFREKAKVTTKTWTDVYAQVHSRTFMVAGAATDALVADFQTAILKALEKGTTLSEFRKDFDAIVAKNGWSGWTGEGSKAGRAWRQEIIYDTNLRTAYAAGRYAQLTDPDVLDYFPGWQYHHSGSLHPRLNHLAWDGLQLKADDPFWDSNYPPNGWRCGCFVTPVSMDGLARAGKKTWDKAPSLNYVPKKAGGKIVEVPEGIDPGFEYNAGKAWLSRTAPGDETVAAAPGVIERFAGAAMRGALSNPHTHIPAAIAPAELADAFAVPTRTEIRLSADTIQRHSYHPEATPKAYSEIVEYAVSEGDFYIDDQKRVSALVEYDGKMWQIGFKKTSKGEIYTTTVHYTHGSKRRQLERRGRNIVKKRK
ncbi:phage minor head protein [Candidatus Tokpelaia sp.]|uniref:phage head morphogenesis protein n=1 Tax=Candidatus Tokpelaia sp. TaxID=2233777 RepID=UPI00123A8586|nr:phage minor head protein [Candidatus Tokpelaia sp.]KAA6404512.1 hypothetical protein DPQ22_09790 [Candidatus Tokpelaia sp.]